MSYGFQVQMKVQRPIAEVFDAVYNPQKLGGYFTTGGASGPLDPGTRVIWRFADYPGDIPVEVKQVIPNQKIAFEWEAAEDFDSDKSKTLESAPASGYNTVVEMTFAALGPEETMVTIAEHGWRENPKGLKRSYENCQGWTQMQCCLKAYVEYGINLRKGAY